MRSGITAAGNWVLDRIKVIDTWPQQDRLANVLSIERAGGGLAYNVLTDLARMKAPFPLRGIGLVGDDEDGRWLIEDARRNGIDVAGVQATREAPTSSTDVMTVRSTGRRTFFHDRGANRLLEDHHIDPGTSRILHLGYLLLLDRIDPIAPRVLKRIRDLGVRTALDVVSESGDKFAKVVLPALDFVDYFILNEIEAGESTGHAIRRADGSFDRTALSASARRLWRENLVVIHMPEGALALSKEGELFVPSRPVTQIKGTAGAGDAFAAGMLYALHEGWPLDRALDLAHRAATACLSHESTTAGLRPVSEL